MVCLDLCFLVLVDAFLHILAVDGEDWSLPFDVPPVPDIPDLDIL